MTEKPCCQYFLKQKENNSMTIKQAIRILDPRTTIETLAEIGYYAGFRSHEAEREAVDEACVLACEVMEKYLEEHGESEESNEETN